MPDPHAPRPRLVVMPFIHCFNPGGVERVALRLCGAWAADPRLDVRLVVGRDEGVMRSEVPPGLALHLIPSWLPTARWESLWMMFVLWRQVRRQRPDVVFAAGNSYAVVAVVLRLLLGRRCPPLVLKVSNDLERRDLPPPVRALYYVWLRIQGRLIDRFTGLAEPMRAEIMAAMRVPAERVEVIEDAAIGDAEVTALARIGATRAAPAGPRHYVGVGRLAKQKNFPLLVAAFARLAATPGNRDRLTIVGEGGGRARLAAQIAALGLGDRVALPGHGAVAPALAAADVFVLSSDYEALPAAVVEALASGLPVVATDCCVSMASLVGNFGRLVPRRDAAALATAMAAQTPLSARARADAAAAMRAFTTERAAGRYARLFRDCQSAARPENAILAA